MLSDKQPMNLAHRGARAIAPENTLAAFAAAQKQGADGVELDVFLCASGELVVTHDDDLTVWSNGKGRVSTSSLSFLKELDFGSHFSSSFAGEQIPTLQEVIDLLDKKMFINIEVKTLSIRPIAEVLAVKQIISKNNLYQRVLVSSFNPLVLYHLKKIDNNIPTGLLFEYRLPIYLSPINNVLLKLQALHPCAKLANEKLMERAKKAGYMVNVWTVNDVSEMQRVINLGVDSIITDYPDRLKKLLVKNNL
jgi:glycerophosphoryl diester phosphodiesterase